MHQNITSLPRNHQSSDDAFRDGNTNGISYLGYADCSARLKAAGSKKICGGLRIRLTPACYTPWPAAGPPDL